MWPRPAREETKKGLAQGPVPGPADDDEREIVVGADDGVDEAERRRRAGQHPDLPADHRPSAIRFGDMSLGYVSPGYPDRPGNGKKNGGR